MSCATDGCDNPECPVCSVPRRFSGMQPSDQDERRKNARALNGTQPREVRDPVWTPRARKALSK